MARKDSKATAFFGTLLTALVLAVMVLVPVALILLLVRLVGWTVM